MGIRRKLGVAWASLMGAIAALCLGGLGAFVSPDPDLVFASGAALAFLFLTLWQENEPPVLMLPFLYQWLAVATKPMMSVVLRVPVSSLAEYDIYLRPGIFLGLGAICVFALGMRLAMGKAKQDWNAALRNEALVLSPRSVLAMAFSAILLGHLLFYLMRYAGPAMQIVYALANVRFVGLFVLAYWAIVNKTGYLYLLAVLMVEIVIGITGFFSDFRAPIFVVAFAALAAAHRPKVRDIAMVAAVVALLVGLGSFWSYIKLDYRDFISGGSGDQVVIVPLGDRIDYITRAAGDFDQSQLATGFDRLLRRQSYVDFLSATMAYVPDSLPHEHGKRIGRTLLHVITPRFLFPDKPPTDFDSDVTQHYTGLPIQIRSGTSISIGWAGEFYIDFGVIGTLLCCLAMGLGFGIAYRHLRRPKTGSLLLLYGVRATVLVLMMSFETALIKYVGGVAMAFAAAYVVERFIAPVLSRRLRLRRLYRQQQAVARPGLPA